MDRAKAGNIKKDLMTLFLTSVVGKEFTKKHNLSVKFGSGRYGDLNYTVKMEMTEVGGEEARDEMDRAIFKAHAPSFGLKADDFSRIFSSYRGERCKIVGSRPRSFKDPSLC